MKDNTHKEEEVEMGVKMKNSKGSIQDFFYVIVIFVVSIMMIGLMMLVWNKIRTTDIFSTPGVSQDIRDDSDRLNSSWDSIFFFFGILIMLTPIVAAFLIGAHPAFIWIAIILGIFVIFFSVIMSNVWDGYINNSNLVLAKAQMPKISFLMNNLPVTLTVFLGLLCVSMFFGWRFKAG